MRAFTGKKPEFVPLIVGWCQDYFEENRLDDWIASKGGWVRIGQYAYFFFSFWVVNKELSWQTIC